MVTTTKKQQIRGVRILLTVFYGFLLSSILFRYIIHGIVETVRRPTNPYAITMIILGAIILISIFLAIYATWYDNAIILLVSGVVLICVFVLTLVFGVIRIINTAPHRIITTTPVSNIVKNEYGVGDGGEVNNAHGQTDTYALVEDITKLIVELVAILFAILATFILHRYVKAKTYTPVSTTETKPK